MNQSVDLIQAGFYVSVGVIAAVILARITLFVVNKVVAHFGGDELSYLNIQGIPGERGFPGEPGARGDRGLKGENWTGIASIPPGFMHGAEGCISSQKGVVTSPEMQHAQDIAVDASAAAAAIAAESATILRTAQALEARRHVSSVDIKYGRDHAHEECDIERLGCSSGESVLRCKAHKVLSCGKNECAIRAEWLHEQKK